MKIERSLSVGIMSDLIYRPYHFGLGDSWATVNLLERTGRAQEKTFKLATNSHGVDMADRLTEIVAELDASHVVLVNEPPNAELDTFDVWAIPYLPTRQVWAFDPTLRTAAVQFDGISNAAGKNPPTSDVLKIMRYLDAAGFKVTPLGAHLSLRTCVHTLATSALFVGCDSGMAHVAHSVGVPTYMLEYSQPVVTCHRQKQYVLCRGGASEFEMHVERYLDLLLAMSGQPRRARRSEPR